jgi:hypothetical protein
LSRSYETTALVDKELGSQRNGASPSQKKVLTPRCGGPAADRRIDDLAANDGAVIDRIADVMQDRIFGRDRALSNYRSPPVRLLILRQPRLTRCAGHDVAGDFQRGEAAAPPAALSGFRRLPLGPARRTRAQ